MISFQLNLQSFQLSLRVLLALLLKYINLLQCKIYLCLFKPNRNQQGGGVVPTLSLSHTHTHAHTHGRVPICFYPVFERAREQQSNGCLRRERPIRLFSPAIARSLSFVKGKKNLFAAFFTLSRAKIKFRSVSCQSLR